MGQEGGWAGTIDMIKTHSSGRVIGAVERRRILTASCTYCSRRAPASAANVAATGLSAAAAWLAISADISFNVSKLKSFSSRVVCSPEELASASDERGHLFANRSAADETRVFRVWHREGHAWQGCGKIQQVCAPSKNCHRLEHDFDRWHKHVARLLLFSPVFGQATLVPFQSFATAALKPNWIAASDGRTVVWLSHHNLSQAAGLRVMRQPFFVGRYSYCRAKALCK